MSLHPATLPIAVLAVALAFAAPHGAHAEDGLPAFRKEIVEAGGASVALYAEETGEGPPILLLHGLAASTFTWRYLVPEFARKHRVIALDLKGFGRSDKPEDQAYSATAQAALVVAFIRKRGLESVTLVGHSFGGAVAVRVALLLKAEPKRLAKLVLIDTPAIPGSLPRYYDFVRVPGALELLLAPFSPEFLARQVLEGARGSRRGITDADIKGYAAPYYDAGAKHAFVATARAIVGDKDPTVVERLRTLDVPALLIWCRDDDIVPLSAGKRLADTMPKATLKTLRGCNHLPQDQRPEALLALMRPFLAD